MRILPGFSTWSRPHDVINIIDLCDGKSIFCVLNRFILTSGTRQRLAARRPKALEILRLSFISTGRGRPSLASSGRIRGIPTRRRRLRASDHRPARERRVQAEARPLLASRRDDGQPRRGGRLRDAACQQRRRGSRRARSGDGDSEHRTRADLVPGPGIEEERQRLDHIE